MQATAFDLKAFFSVVAKHPVDVSAADDRPGFDVGRYVLVLRSGSAGSGASGDGREFSIEREYEDVASVVAAVEAPVTLFGHSYGALCVLGAARLDGAVDRLVLYEPPLPVDGPPSQQVMARARSARDAGDPRGALTVLLREVVQLSEDEFTFVTALPEEWFQAFAGTAIREMEAASALDPDPRRYEGLESETLFLLGTESPQHVTNATYGLASALPNADIVMLEGQAHNAILIAPDLIATEIKRFAAGGEPR